MKKLFLRLKHLIFLIKYKGISWTYNYIYFLNFYGTRNKYLLKYLYKFSPYPYFIEIETSTYCPLKCIMCEHTYWKEKEQQISFAEFKHIVDQFPRLKWIGLTGIGESFLNKDFFKMLRYLKKKNPAIYIELYDVLLYLNKNKIQEIIKLGIDKLIISLDAASKETYQKVRVGSNWEKVLSNLQTLMETKHKLNKPFPEIGFHFIINKLNVQEILPFMDLVYKYTGKSSYILFTRMLHKFKQVEKYYVDVSEDIIQQGNKKAKKYQMRVAWSLNISKNKLPTNYCTAWTMPFIFVSGEVIPCCAVNEANKRDLQKINSFGNVFEKSFKEIWHNKKYTKFRKKLSQGKIPVQCSYCEIFKVN